MVVLETRINILIYNNLSWINIYLVSNTIQKLCSYIVLFPSYSFVL